MSRNVLAIAALCGAAAVASGATISHTGSISSTTTNWNAPINTLPLFDPALGTLNSVSWTLSGDVAGSAAFESLDAGPAMISLDLAATLTLFAPDNSILQVTIPTVNTTVNAAAFDGTIDFGGTSGGLYNALSGNASAGNSSSAPAVLALFTGLGNTSISIFATGSSSGSGGGNLITQFATSAGASWEIVYDYTPVPTPGALALLGMGGLIAGRRRR